jgi:hypothetical protein
MVVPRHCGEEIMYLSNGYKGADPERKVKKSTERERAKTT